MTKYPTLIQEVCKTEKTINNVSKMIPVLIRWAQSGQANTYGDLAREIGNPNLRQGMGSQLGYLDDVMRKLEEVSGLTIPTLNALVQNKQGVPSHGFSYVYEGYDELSIKVQKDLAREQNNKAFQYKDWNLVLELLGLKPSIAVPEKEEKKIRTGSFSHGGEGVKHKALKEYVCAHPEAVGLRNIALSETEHVLLSGDRLDVYFEQKDGTFIAVEVKSIISDDADILRGIYQCVKYQAVLDAESRTHSRPAKNKTLLVIEGELSQENYQVKDSLGIEVFESFKIK